MSKLSLRTASIYCLAIWAAVWLLFFLIRVSSFDIRVIPGIGPVMLIALIVSVAAPCVAIVIVGIAIFRQPGVFRNWVVLGCAIAAAAALGAVFTVTRWL